MILVPAGVTQLEQTINLRWSDWRHRGALTNSSIKVGFELFEFVAVS
jgi:hypothetical protein